MALSQKLQQTQGQHLTMTPQLQQSLKILQLSGVELESYLQQELESNPLLDDAPAEFSDAPDDQAEETPESNEPKNPYDLEQDVVWQDRLEEAPQRELYGSTVPHEITSHGAVQDAHAYDWLMEQVTENKPSLRKHLMEQIVVELHDETEQRIALHLVDGLESSGYYTKDCGEVAKKLGCSEALLQTVLQKLKTLEPAGVFARNLQECLTLQLQDRGEWNKEMQAIVEHLELLAEGNIAGLQKRSGCSEAEVLALCKKIRMLNPKPGESYITENTAFARADVVLHQFEDGGWRVELNDEALPKVLVNNRYYMEIKKKTGDAEEKKFLTERYQSANWLVRALNQRAETILKVATEIVKQQQAFFEKGIYYLRPITFQEIAKALDIHESTVGRAVNHKYMLTSRGVFELRYFFSSTIHNAVGSADYSSKTIQHMIRELVEQEAFKKPLSDDKIANLLQAKGIEVARRTVTKYREGMNIPSSVERKRLKRFS